jgi:hypothetical protein
MRQLRRGTQRTRGGLDWRQWLTTVCVYEQTRTRQQPGKIVTFESGSLIVP